MLTSKDIRLAYAALHGVTSIAEYEKYDLMNAKQYPAEWLELPIAEFMVKAGFVEAMQVEKTAEAGFISKPVANRAKAQAEAKPKRKYTKKIK